MIEALLSFGTQFWPYITGFLALVGVYFAGGRHARNDMRVEDLEGALDVHKRADEAVRRYDGDNRPVDDRLRDLGGLRD